MAGLLFNGNNFVFIDTVMEVNMTELVILSHDLLFCLGLQVRWLCCANWTPKKETRISCTSNRCIQKDSALTVWNSEDRVTEGYKMERS